MMSDQTKTSAPSIGLDATEPSQRLSVDELRIISDLTFKLVELRWQSCKHLCVENCAILIFRALTSTLEGKPVEIPLISNK